MENWISARSPEEEPIHMLMIVVSSMLYMLSQFPLRISEFPILWVCLNEKPIGYVI